jgi:hypothetical protein
VCSDKSYATYSHYSKLAGNIVMPWVSRKRTQPRCCCYHFVADDTVESLISFTDFIIKKEVMELKVANQLLQPCTNYLGKAVKEYIFKTRRLFKTNLKVENFDYPSVNVIARLMELILN